MKILEALIKIRDNNVTIIDEHGNKVRKGNGARNPFDIYEVVSGEWIHLTSFPNLMDSGEWEIYEEPEENLHVALCFVITDFNEEQVAWGHVNLPAKNKSGGEAWRLALKTFFEIKCHPLCKLPETLNDSYVFMRGLTSGNEIEFSGNYTDCKGKLWSYSMFYFRNNSEMDEAIKDIGKERIIHMFKTFQGILNER